MREGLEECRRQSKMGNPMGLNYKWLFLGAQWAGFLRLFHFASKAKAGALKSLTVNRRN